jgi:K+-transporting ATPase KdpF subunit
VSAIHILAAVLTLGLLVYLSFALLAPERFQ